jgi:CheY-like chemotaxis protein
MLIAEPEPAHALSTRKLVLETAKLNVITAHSGSETLEFLPKFPNVDVVIVHSEMRDVSAELLFGKLKEMDSEKPTILLMSGVERSRKDADHILPSDEPEQLLHLLRQLFGDPASRRHNLWLLISGYLRSHYLF